MRIPVNIEELLSEKIIEGSRLEFKKGWNPTPILRTICAFANDFDDEGSGYIIIGIEENNGKPIRPILGFTPEDFDKVNKELVGYCNQIEPTYLPRISLEELDGKHILVIWCPSGSNRPYKVPDDLTSKKTFLNYRIRFGGTSIVPNEEQTSELIQLTAKIPFDDRVNTFASISDLSRTLIRNHLEEIGSKLYLESENMSLLDLAISLNLCQGSNEHLFPKNIGLLMFSKKTQDFFKNAIIEVIEFPNGLTESYTEKVFEGTIQKQLVDVLEYFKINVIKEKVVKRKNQEISDRYYNFPFNAIEEAIVNAVYHRNYELPDPIEIRILPTHIEIISYNGVDPSLKQSDFDLGRVRARRYRNRRIGDFLKELKLTEGRGTGISTILKSLVDNGSSKPVFDTNDPDRLFFLVEIPIHSAFTPMTISDFDEKEMFIIDFCSTPKSKTEILNSIGLKNHPDSFTRHILPLIERNYIEHTIKNNLKHRNQKYVQIGLGALVLEQYKR